jgi:hypothetical protein
MFTIPFMPGITAGFDWPIPISAARQGGFQEMHDALFSLQNLPDTSDVFRDVKGGGKCICYLRQIIYLYGRIINAKILFNYEKDCYFVGSTDVDCCFFLPQAQA